MPQWEYEVVYISDRHDTNALLEGMNERGKRGWKLVQITTWDSSHRAFFKRQIAASETMEPSRP